MYNLLLKCLVYELLPVLNMGELQKLRVEIQIGCVPNWNSDVFLFTFESVGGGLLASQISSERFQR